MCYNEATGGEERQGRMSIGTRIKSRRIELGMTQDELAKLVGLRNKSSISLLENGQGDPSQTMIQKYADALDCDPLWLMGIPQDPEYTDSWKNDPYCASAAEFLFEHREYRKLFDLIEKVPMKNIERVSIALELMIK